MKHYELVEELDTRLHGVKPMDMIEGVLYRSIGPVHEGDIYLKLNLGVLVNLSQCTVAGPGNIALSKMRLVELKPGESVVLTQLDRRMSDK